MAPTSCTSSSLSNSPSSSDDLAAKGSVGGALEEARAARRSLVGSNVISSTGLLSFAGGATAPPSVPRWAQNASDDESARPGLDLMFASIEAGIDMPQLKLEHKPLKNWDAACAAVEDDDQLVSHYNRKGLQATAAASLTPCKPGRWGPKQAPLAASRGIGHAIPPMPSLNQCGGRKGESGSGSWPADNADAADDDEDFAHARKMAHSSSRQLMLAQVIGPAA